MNNEQRIKMALAYTGKTQGWLAEKLGTSPQNFNTKLKRNTLPPEDMEKIAAIFGAVYEVAFVFPDGKRI